MKHVIIIETVDPEAGGEPIPERLEKFYTDKLEAAILADTGRPCVVRSVFNINSAITAVHEMYGAPKWEGQ